jgi:hypothetical protein
MIKFLKEHDHLQNGLNVLYLKGNSLSFKYLTRDPHELTVRTLRVLINPKQIKHHKALCYYTKQNYIIGGTADAIKIRTRQ